MEYLHQNPSIHYLFSLGVIHWARGVQPGQVARPSHGNTEIEDKQNSTDNKIK